MAYWINRNGPWTQISEAAGTAQKIFVRALGNWEQAQRIFVMQDGTWRRVYARIPTAPSSVSMTVNGSSASSVTVSSTSFSVNTTWTNNEAPLPVEVKFMNGASQIGSTQSLGKGSTSTSETVSITQGQTINLTTFVRSRNGGTSVEASDIYSSTGSSNAITVTYPSPVITVVSITRVADTSDIAINWTVTNAPTSNFYYTVEWQDNISNIGYRALSDAVNTDQSASLPFTTHGNILLTGSSVFVDVFAAVTLFVNGVQSGSVAYGQAAFPINAES